MFFLQIFAWFALFVSLKSLLKFHFPDPLSKMFFLNVILYVFILLCFSFSFNKNKGSKIILQLWDLNFYKIYWSDIG